MSTESNYDKKVKEFAALLKEVRRDPNSGLKEINRIYGKMILMAARTVCHYQDIAEEVLNDVLLKIMYEARKDVIVKNPAGWLFVITKNVAKDTMKGRRFDLPLNENILCGRNNAEDFIEKDTFYWMIMDLSATEQQVMIEKFLADYTFSDIAADLQIPLSTVTSIYYRSLPKVKAKIEK